MKICAARTLQPFLRVLFLNMLRRYDVLRTELDQDKLDAWTNGLTGFPMVKHCLQLLLHEYFSGHFI
jgi:hypothetical protein